MSVKMPGRFTSISPHVGLGSRLESVQRREAEFEEVAEAIFIV